jgi:antitoxin ParD1/3/4
MARNTSILIGEYYENFINGQSATGKYSSMMKFVRMHIETFRRRKFKKIFD